ncbi:MAG: PAS domain S-box protein [Deltaproteobacteria bacterium]|jgi:PAS domain S-box-containing protein|nr:PAS domain S-box protein [Deltaproteobacteria bacterium]
MTDQKIPDSMNPRLVQLGRIVDELVGRYRPAGAQEGRDDGDVLDGALNGLKALQEMDVLRQLPTSRFQEILTSAVSTEWYDNILNAIAEVLIVIGRTGRIQSANPAAQVFLGYSVEQIEGMFFRDVLSGKTPSMDSLLAERCGVPNGSQPVRTFYRHADGSQLPVDFSSSPICDDEGNLRAVVCMARDVRSRIQTEHRLRDSEERYALAARGANDGLWEWNSRTDVNYYSPRFAELLHYPNAVVPHEIKLVEELVHPDDRERVREALTRYSDSEPFDVECRLRAFAGDYRFFSLRGLGVWNTEREITRMVGSVRDITERRQTEELRNRFIERVISAEDAERRRIARELHDETGQSLTSVMVGLKAIESSIEPTEARNRVAHIRSLVGRTLEEVGRLARGLHPSVLDDLGFATAIGRYASEYSKAHRVMVDVHLRGVDAENRLPLVVETTLYRILQEALTNIAKHAEATTASIIVERQGSKVRAIIEDDGRGFDLSESEGVTTLDMSHGLGLHGIRERAALLKGWVTVESTPGMGTTLYVHLPIPELDTSTADLAGDQDISTNSSADDG